MQNEMKPLGKKIPEHRLKLWSVVVLQLLERIERSSLGQRRLNGKQLFLHPVRATGDEPQVIRRRAVHSICRGDQAVNRCAGNCDAAGSQFEPTAALHSTRQSPLWVDWPDRCDFKGIALNRARVALLRTYTRG